MVIVQKGRSQAIRIFLVFAFAASAAHAATAQVVDTVDSVTKKITDTSSVFSSLINGNLDAGFRYVFMATDNAKYLSDYYANGMAMHLKYETTPYKKISIGAGGALLVNVKSADLLLPDSSTKKTSRYETGLFDIQHPADKIFARPEELYVSYRGKNITVIAGRQSVNTPFINVQDGRLRPNLVSGIWAKKKWKRTKFEGGYIYAVSPRSTRSWMPVSQSIGIYPQGLNENGEKAQYNGYLQSKGIFVAGLTHAVAANLDVQLWNQYVDHIFNTVMLQAEWKLPADSVSSWVAGLQLITQQKINDGGNADAAHSYFTDAHSPFIISAKAGWTNNQFDVSLNYTRITKSSRYLMPREWGKDPFYTFLPRERNSGFGDVHAMAAKMAVKFSAFNLAVNAGYFKMPEIKNYRLNKFGMPSYYQFNTDLKYHFGGRLKGLQIQLLYVYKKQAGEKLPDDKNVINKVNMSLYNMAVNYNF